jgi:hypothetical protein
MVRPKSNVNDQRETSGNFISACVASNYKKMRSVKPSVQCLAVERPQNSQHNRRNRSVER